MKFLPPPLLSLILMALPALSYASPQPAIVPDEYLYLMPRNTIFYRQVNDLQTFTGNLGGASASPITNSGDPKRPFSVDGETLTDFKTAGQKSCDNQANKCSQAANAQGNKGAFKVSDCDSQKQQCVDAQNNAKVQSFQGAAVASENIGQDPNPEFADFDLICEV